jgi:ATP-dependent protease HslVU (ClpYQ) ATPase subunit
MQPEEITKELDRFIVGQSEAKKAVAVAMRARSMSILLSFSIIFDVYSQATDGDVSKCLSR